MWKKLIELIRAWYESRNDKSKTKPKPNPPKEDYEIKEFVPDPVLIRYQFIFADGTTLVFKENHSGDYWGDYPAAGWGEISNPRGEKTGVDVNRKIRHGGLKKAKQPITTAQHGKRMFWMADSEGQLNVKRVTIYEDGWNPLVEGSVLAVQNDIGIFAELQSCKVTIEKTK